MTALSPASPQAQSAGLEFAQQPAGCFAQHFVLGRLPSNQSAVGASQVI
ncbi:MAG: hypothetical protein IPI49_09650 [Myxococcales bacterium]|nr:hypothetical protein [Myxococcales bacterium]